MFSNKNNLYLQQVESTNTHLQLLLEKNKVSDAFFIFSFDQTKGRGQRGNLWLSEPGKNIAFSQVIFPNYLQIKEQFFISIAVSLAVRNFIESKIGAHKKVQIKWPNDILVDDKKVAGILIENTIGSNAITQSIIGIGINVNQQTFPALERNATSCFIESKIEFDLEKCVDELADFLNAYYIKLRGDKNNLMNEYHSHLYKLNTLAKFKSVATVFEGSIVSVLATGLLRIKKNDNSVQEFAMKEITFL